MLSLERVRVDLGGERVLQGLDLAISGPGLIALMGPSGVGKTTLLRLMAGLIAPTAGAMRTDMRSAIVFQDARLLPWRSALENAGFGLRARGLRPAEARRRAGVVLEALGLSADDFSKRPAALSGGMRQRVALARALAVDPDLLLLDEPFSGLDPAARDELRTLVRRVVSQRGLTAVLVTHDPVEAVTVADRIVVLGGRPARQAADILRPARAASPAKAYRMAADLMARPDVAAAMAWRHGRRGGGAPSLER